VHHALKATPKVIAIGFMIDGEGPLETPDANEYKNTLPQAIAR